MKQPLIVSVILNTNRREDTLACLQSLTRTQYANMKTIVLDNSSTDGSVDAICNQFPDVQIIHLAENLGYAGNNNVGIKEALKLGAEWVFVLNEDVILDQNCIQQLIDIGESDPNIGIVGPLVYHYDEPTVIQSAGGMLGKYWESIHLGQNEPDQGQFINPRQVEWISGCAILVRSTAIEQAGMLDSGFFIYWEETEWCIRIGRAGWKIVHVPLAKLWHKGVQRNYSPKPSFTYYATRNHLIALSKHRAPFIARIYTWFQIARTLVSWTVKSKWRDKLEHRNAMWRGVVDYMLSRQGQMSAPKR
jgi:GT2 family glycosyltransferase